MAENVSGCFFFLNALYKHRQQTVHDDVTLLAQASKLLTKHPSTTLEMSVTMNTFQHCIQRSQNSPQQINPLTPTVAIWVQL